MQSCVENVEKTAEQMLICCIGIKCHVLKQKNVHAVQRLGIALDQNRCNSMNILYLQIVEIISSYCLPALRVSGFGMQLCEASN